MIPMWKSKVWASQKPLVSLGSGRPLDPYFPLAQRRRSVGSVAVAIHVRGAEPRIAMGLDLVMPGAKKKNGAIGVINMGISMVNGD